jgi:hypothetical protein
MRTALVAALTIFMLVSAAAAAAPDYASVPICTGARIAWKSYAARW